MADSVEVTAEKIKKLQVQGARNVAIAATRALQTLAMETEAKTKQQLLAELKEAQITFNAARETEPLMRNALRYVINQTKNAPTEEIDGLRETIGATASQFLKDLEASRERTAEIGAKRITDGSIVFTHCHSSTVTRLLAKAKAEGKSFIETTFIVDSAARTFMGDADIVVVGADAITSEGNVVNKIGTSNLSVLAHESRKPFYVVSELLKFDPETLSGQREKIEQRSPAEVWAEAPSKLIVKNPAFDVTPSRYIHGLICEEGIIPSQTIVGVIRSRYPWVFQ